MCEVGVLSVTEQTNNQSSRADFLPYSAQVNVSAAAKPEVYAGKREGENVAFNAFGYCT